MIHGMIHRLFRLRVRSPSGEMLIEHAFAQFCRGKPDMVAVAYCGLRDVNAYGVHGKKLIIEIEDLTSEEGGV